MNRLHIALMLLAIWFGASVVVAIILARLSRCVAHAQQSHGHRVAETDGAVQSHGGED